jgi:ribokinase
MYDIITFGSATRDVFLRSEGFKIKEEKMFFDGRGICVSLGSKIPIKEIHFFSGGGGTNTAFTFKNHGFKVAYCGMVGDDFGGREVIRQLKKHGVATDLISLNKKHHTNYSIVLSTEKERTILIFRGASENFKEKDIPRENLKTKWFYLAPLSRKLVRIFEPLLRFAKRNKIKLAINPGNTQLSLSQPKLKRLLNFADVLFLNQEEASLATNLPYHKERDIFKTLDEWVEGIVVMTKGPFGAVVSDGKYLYRVGILKIPKVIDRTGAGDAFASGFLVGLMRSKG